MPNSILVIYAHPSPNKSKVNRHLFGAVNDCDFAYGQDLYEQYPDLHVDVAVEQQLLRQHDALVFQFPLYWYSAPALLKEWCDNVLTSGFAHGDGERVLKGKPFMLAVTTGGSPEAYAEDKAHGAPLDTYLAPFLQTARFCGMELLDPFVVQGVGALDDGDVGKIKLRYQRRLEELRG